MTIYHADSAAVRLLQIVLILIGTLISLGVWLFLHPYPTAVSIVCGIAAGAAIVSGWIIMPLFLHSIRCLVTDGQIAVQCGVFLKREQSVRLRNIQFVQFLHGPLDGRWGLNFIILHVYGGRLILPFLHREDRRTLEEYLRKKGVFHAP